MKKAKNILSKIFMWVFIIGSIFFAPSYLFDFVDKLTNPPPTEEELKQRKLEQIEAIEEYESLYPKYAEDLDVFLATGEPNVLTEDDKIIIKYHIYEMEEPYRTILLENIDEFEIGHMTDDETDGVDAYFSPYDNKVYFETISMQLQNMRDAFSANRVNYISANGFSMNSVCYALVHESAHAIDYYYGEDDYMTENYTIYSEAMGKDVTLQETIIYDVYTYIENIIRRNTSDEEEVNNILQTFYYGSNATAEQLTENEQRIRKSVITECNNGITWGFVVEEMYYTVAGSEFKTDLVMFERGGHDLDYYWDENGEPTGKMSQELWAEFFAQVGFHYNIVEEQVQEYLPESYRILQAMREQICQEIEAAEGTE